jgi:predicted dehydrogenase
MSELRVGLVGCGNITLRAHAPALRQVPGARVVGVVDPVATRREQALELLELPSEAGHADLTTLLAAGVDYVTVTVPQRFRRPIVSACAEAGVHVLCEKPLAIAPAEAEQMAAEMQARDLRFGMVHNYLYYPEYELARRLIAEGAIGRLRHVMLNFLGMPDNPGAQEYRPSWRHDPWEAGGGVLMDMVHVIYLTEFFFNGPIRSVSAVVDNLEHPGEAVEDFALVQFGFDEGYATVNMWWGGGPGGLEISGSSGRIVAFYQNYDTGPFTTLESFTLVNAQGRQALTPRAEAVLSDNFVRLHADFAEAVREGRDPIAPAESGRRTLEAALGAYTSAALGQVVALPLDRAHPVYQRGIQGLAALPLWADSPLCRRSLFGLSPAQAAPPALTERQ